MKLVTISAMLSIAFTAQANYERLTSPLPAKLVVGEIICVSAHTLAAKLDPNWPLIEARAQELRDLEFDNHVKGEPCLPVKVTKIIDEKKIPVGMSRQVEVSLEKIPGYKSKTLQIELREISSYTKGPMKRGEKALVFDPFDAENSVQVVEILSSISNLAELPSNFLGYTIYRLANGKVGRTGYNKLQPLSLDNPSETCIITDKAGDARFCKGKQSLAFVKNLLVTTAEPVEIVTAGILYYDKDKNKYYQYAFVQNMLNGAYHLVHNYFGEGIQMFTDYLFEMKKACVQNSKGSFCPDDLVKVGSINDVSVFDFSGTERRVVGSINIYGIDQVLVDLDDSTYAVVPPSSLEKR